MNIETYKMENGYYSTARIRTDSGAMDDRSAFFLDIFGSFDDDGKDDGGALPGEWQALLEEATRRNNEMIAVEQAAKEMEARAIVTQPNDDWSRQDWNRLVTLGYAVAHTDDGGEQGYMSRSYRLNEAGERLLALS